MGGSKLKVTRTQMMWLVYCINVGLPIYLSGMISNAKQDAWISGTLAGTFGFIVIALATRNAMHYPGQTFIQFSQQVLGKWLGRFWVLPYLAFWMVSMGNILRSVVDFIIMALFKETPIVVVIIGVFIAVAFAVITNGITTIGRCAELMGPLIVVMFISIYILSFSNLDYNFLLPIAVDNSPLKLIKGALNMMELYGDSYLIVMIYGFLDKQKGVIPRIYIGFGLAMCFILLTIIFILLTFGPGMAAKMQYPLYELVRYIEVGEFLQRIEVVMIGMWIFSVFVKLGFYLFCISYGTAQWLGIKKWKILVIPVSLIAIWAAGLPSSLLTTRVIFLRFIDPVILPILYVIMPLIMWLMILLHKKKQNVQSRRTPVIPKVGWGWKLSGMTMLILLVGVYYFVYIQYFRM
jgi:spore germination protein KB